MFCRREKKSLLPPPGIKQDTFDLPSPSLVTILVELSCLIYILDVLYYLFNLRMDQCINLSTRFQASAAVQLMPQIFCHVTQRTLVIPYRRFGTAMLLKVGLVSCPEISVYNYEQALCNISEELRPLHPLDHAMIQGRNQILGRNQYI